LRAKCARILRQMSEEQTQAPEGSEPSGEECEICGAEMYGLHCKLVCPNCGYRRDCSDP
jgi:transposase